MYATMEDQLLIQIIFTDITDFDNEHTFASAS